MLVRLLGCGLQYCACMPALRGGKDRHGHCNQHDMAVKSALPASNDRARVMHPAALKWKNETPRLLLFYIEKLEVNPSFPRLPFS